MRNTVGTGKRFHVDVEQFDGELGGVLGHACQLTSSSQLSALNEAAETTADACRVGAVQLARPDLRGHERHVVAILVPPNVAALVLHRVAHRTGPGTVYQPQQF